MIALVLALLALAFLVLIAGTAAALGVQSVTGSEEAGFGAFFATFLIGFTIAALLAAHVINAR